MKTKTVLIALSCMLALIFSSCKKEKNKNGDDGTPSPVATTEKGTLLFHLHTYIDGTEVDGYNITYTTSLGRKMSLSLAQLYISDIRITKLDGTVYSVADKKIIKILESDVFEIGDVPAGNYKSVTFNVGLPAATNSKNPGESIDSTMLKRTEMWFNSSAAQPDGYVFLNVQGLIDTSADLSSKMCPFVYKIGTNANYKEVTVVQNFGISPNTVNYFHMLADYSQLFSGITLDNQLNLTIETLADNASATAIQITNNIPKMFGVEN
jgi:hypothetical protein